MYSYLVYPAILLQASASWLQVLQHPALSAVLVTLIFGGLILELKAPGVTFPGLVALAAALLFFIPRYAAGFATPAEILLFIVGAMLLALEVYVIPGFGVVGVAGLACTVLSLTASMVGHQGLNFAQVNWAQASNSLALVLFSLVAAVLGALWLSRFLLQGRRGSPIVQPHTLAAAAGYTSLDSRFTGFIGQTVECTTDLRPTGLVLLNGERLEAQSDGKFIPRGTQVQVLGLQGNVLVVGPLTQSA